MIYTGKNVSTYHVENQCFASGGEGGIYNIVGNPNLVAKIYHPASRTNIRQRKLVAMVDTTAPSPHCTWPIDTLYDSGQFVGFVMQKCNTGIMINDFFVIDNRKDLPYTLYLQAALNLVSLVRDFHGSGQIIGDFRPDNILVTRTGEIVLVDIDSNGLILGNQYYPCMVGTAEYLPKELQGKHFPSLPRDQSFNQYSDNFALAVLLFQLLNNGVHPFSCKKVTASSAMFQMEDRIVEGATPFFPESSPKMKNYTNTLYAFTMAELPEDIVALFRRAFVTGHNNPSIRPTPKEWYQAIQRYEANLQQCKKDKYHQYYNQLSACPHCRVLKDIAQNNKVQRKNKEKVTPSKVPSKVPPKIIPKPAPIISPFGELLSKLTILVTFAILMGLHHLITTYWFYFPLVSIPLAWVGTVIIGYFVDGLTGGRIDLVTDCFTLVGLYVLCVAFGLAFSVCKDICGLPTYLSISGGVVGIFMVLSWDYFLDFDVMDDILDYCGLCFPALFVYPGYYLAYNFIGLSQSPSILVGFFVALLFAFVAYILDLDLSEWSLYLLGIIAYVFPFGLGYVLSSEVFGLSLAFSILSGLFTGGAVMAILD